MTVKSYDVSMSSYSGNYDYDRTECTGSCDSICRCTKIINVRIISLENALSMVNIYENNKTNRRGFGRRSAKLSTIVEYAIDRLFRIHRLYELDRWGVKIVGGYYGEEVSGVYLENKNLESTFLSDVRAVLKMTDDIEIIKYVLLQEYKYIHDSIEHVTKCYVEELHSDDLVRQEEHFSRVKRNESTEYGMIEGLPIGIVYNGVRLIDGYHRLALSGPGVHKFIVIC